MVDKNVYELTAVILRSRNVLLFKLLFIMIHPINIPADLLAPNSTSRPETFAVKRSRHSVSYTADGRRLVDGILATPSSPVNLWGELFVRSAVDRFNIEHKPRPNHKSSPITQNSIPKCQSVGDAFNEHGNVTVSNKSQSLDNISQVQPNIENGFCDDNLVYTELCSCSMPFTPCCSAEADCRKELIRLNVQNVNQSDAKSNQNNRKNWMTLIRTQSREHVTVEMSRKFQQQHHFVRNADTSNKFDKQHVSLFITTVTISEHTIIICMHLRNHTHSSKIFRALIHNHLVVKNRPEKLLSTQRHALEIPSHQDRDLEIQIETDTQLDDMPDGIGKRLVITVNGDVV